LPAPRRRPLELAIPFLVAATVFAFACGSSSIPAVTGVGHSARWAMLGLLLAAAAARALLVRRLPPGVGSALAATWLVLLALVSSAWSVAPRLSFERGISLGLLFATALLLVASESSPRRLLIGLVAGAAAVGVAGLVVLVADHSAAVQPASYEFASRFQGFGQNANTDALLFAIVLAPAASLALEAHGRLARAAAAGVVALLVGSIVASGSRGALFAGGAGALVAVVARAGRLRRALQAGALVVAATVAGLLIQNVPQPSASGGSSAAVPAAPGPAPKDGYQNAEAAYPLEADVGGPLPGGGQPTIHRGFFGGSGRLEAWIGAVHQALERPLLGFGFGAEARVFVDRYYYFVGGSPENSYIGVSLQLGIVGLLSLLALVGAVFANAGRGLRRRYPAMTAACLGAVVAGLVIAAVQSYLYSVGNIGSATFWICAFLLPALAPGDLRV
jgi:O-antigen ligase